MTLASTPTLAELQHSFASALHYRATGNECNIISNVFSADERMQIYRNNFIISLSEVLQATYPMLHALWGAECFEQVARQHVLNCPLLSGDVSHYGEHFDKTIERFPSVIEAAPYSAEVARFEWQIDLAQQLSSQASTVELLPLADLANIAPQYQPKIRLQLNTGVLSFHSCYALFSLQRAIKTGQFDELNLEQAEQGVIAASPEHGIWSLPLSTEHYQLLSYLQSQCSLGEIPANLLSHLDWFTQHSLLAGFSITALQGE